tara:strand:- start:665 stop:1183 length:519 start_codon:yes stop_codon:yes gene_type:complete
MLLSKNFTLKEFLKSNVAKRRGLELNPPKEHIRNMQMLCIKVLQPLRDYLGPIKINSGWRSLELNKALGGAYREKKNKDGSITKIYSQHCKGQAADLHFVDKNGKANNKMIFDAILKLGIEFDQMINEFDYRWIHISFVCCKEGKNRNRLLEAYKDENNRTKYKRIKEYKSL